MKQVEFSLINYLRSKTAGTWTVADSHESRISKIMAANLGQPAGNCDRVPDDILCRDLVAGTASAGGHLVTPTNLGYVAALQPYSACLRLGAQIVPLPTPTGQIAVPRGTSGISTTWLALEATQGSETQPAFGSVAGTPKIVSAYAELSRQLLLQSNAEDVIKIEFARAAGAALDAAILNGSGANGQPLGIIGTPGVGAFTGASLNQAALRNAQADVAAANAVVTGQTGYVTTPAVAEVLATRQRFTGSDRALWEGKLQDGVLEGERAIATSNMPAGTIIHGDFGTIMVPQWTGGLQIEVNPYANFQAGLVSVRLLLACDVIVTRPQSFSIASSIT